MEQVAFAIQVLSLRSLPDSDSPQNQESGQEKVQTVARPRREDLPPPGETLSRSKHKVIARVVGKDPQFVKFMGKNSTTRSQIQQTELGHFTPPTQKTKARFMNLGSLLKWAQMVSFH